MEDYFGVHQITEEADKINRFKDTLFETARKWAQALRHTDVTKFDYDPSNANDKIASMKYLFLARFAKGGRTLEAAYSAWGALTFDPNKDDMEQFIQKVEELAKKLGYNQDAQVMAVKSVLPRDVYGICMTYKTLKELKTFLIELFSNPKMREAVPGTASAVAEPGVFSIGQHMENNVVGPTAADVSRIHQDMNDLQVRFNKITSADFRSKSSKPWKPEVTPPRRRGGFNRGRGGRQFDNAQRNDRFKNSESNSNQDRDNGQRNNAVNFRSRGQGRGNFRGNMRGKGRGRGKYLSNGNPMKVFFDSGASRSYLSKRFYDSNPVLHDMTKFVTTCTGIGIGNGSIVPALYVIPILFMACGHTFEIFTIVAEIDDDMDLVFGFKNMVETEGMLNTRTGEYDFIGRSIPIFPQNDLDVPVREKHTLK